MFIFFSFSLDKSFGFIYLIYALIIGIGLPYFKFKIIKPVSNITRKQRMACYSIIVEGVVIDVERKLVGRRYFWFANFPTIKYEYNGRTFYSDENRYTFKRIKVGDKVKMYIDPERLLRVDSHIPEFDYLSQGNESFWAPENLLLIAFIWFILAIPDIIAFFVFFVF